MVRLRDESAAYINQSEDLRGKLSALLDRLRKAMQPSTASTTPPPSEHSAAADSSRIELPPHHACPLFFTARELQAQMLNPEVPCNLVSEPYESEELYLNTHFHLMRAECFDAVRKGVATPLPDSVDEREEPLPRYQGVHLLSLAPLPHGKGVAFEVPSATLLRLSTL